MGVIKGIRRLHSLSAFVHCARMQAVLDYLTAHRARFEEELCEYLRLPSVSAQSDHDCDTRATADLSLIHI